MKRFILAIFYTVVSLIFLTPVVHAAPPIQTAPANIQENIVLSLPESALAQAIAAVIPFSFDSASNMIQGKITVRGVHNLRLGNNNLRARLDLVGNNLEVVTELAGQRLKMKVGEVAVAADVMAELRFDGQRQILYVKPVVDHSQNIEGNDIGRGLVALLDGREFPLTMKDIEPFVVELGGKTISIATKVADIRALPKKLELSLSPRVSAGRGGKATRITN